MFSLAGSAWQRGSASAVYHVAIAAALLHLAAAMKLPAKVFIVGKALSVVLSKPRKASLSSSPVQGE
eukprot:15616-Heterococcus_DN1.PRE.6